MASPLRIVILGGGTSGWMCAAALSAALKPDLCAVTLIESDEIGTVGVGEATLPQIKEFNDFAGVNEADFMRRTNASFKLGIEFVDWGRKGNRYIHPFGTFGSAMAGADFTHHWTRARLNGFGGDLEDYSFAIVAARRNRFDFPSEDAQSIRSTFSYAYHFDAGLYAQYLRDLSESRGVARIEGKVQSAVLNDQSGDIERLLLAGGHVVEGDIFVDCSGFRGLLIEQHLKTGWEDWSAWLPCDRAVAAPCARGGDFTPYTRATALEAGWRWRIPLQHRTGNGYVYCSQFIDDDAAAARLLDGLDGAPQGDPKCLRFQAGRRKLSWNRNCVTIGLSSGFLEPLESTSIYLAQIAIINLIELLPNDPQQRIDPRLRDEFNRLIDIEYERVRDFLILHYHAMSRDDAELWRYTRAMEVPDSLRHKIAEFRRRGYIHRYNDGLFSPASWLAVFAGQDVLPEGYDRLADNLSLEALRDRLEEQKRRILSNVEAMSSHEDFVRDYCYLPPQMAQAGALTL